MIDAARKGDFEGLKDELKNGADIDFQGEEGYSALHIAALLGDIHVVKFLVENNANIELTDDKGQTPVIKAMGWNQDDIVRFLVDKGADPYKTDLNQQSMFSMANEEIKAYVNSFMEHASLEKSISSGDELTSHVGF